LDDATLGQVQSAECDLSHWQIAAISNFPALKGRAACAAGASDLCHPVQIVLAAAYAAFSASKASIPPGLASRRRVVRAGSSECKACVIYVTVGSLRSV
jgi:hypothetical protein